TRGYTTEWPGWEKNLGPLTGLTATANLAVLGTDSNPVTGPSYEYLVSAAVGGSPSFTLPHPPSTGAQTQSKLPHRVRLHDTALETIPPGGWGYSNATNPSDGSSIRNGAIKLTTGNFVANDIYEFTYTAKNPTVNGLGLAAIRDFNSFLRYSSHDDMGHPNPI